jgi:hypothetical protein
MPAIVCRRCHFKMDLLTVIDDGRARDALAAAMRLPAGVGETVQAYLALFESDARGLTWARYGAILESLVKLLAEPLVEWKGNRRPVHLGTWVACMQQMTAGAADLELPVKNHNYLRAMVYRQADRAEAQAEAQRIEQARAKPRPAAMPPADGAEGTGARPKPVAEHLAKLAPGLRRPKDGD